MKLDLGKVFFFILLLVLSTMTAMAGNIKGTVLDKQTKEPLTGATIQITGTALGVVADIDGNYTLNVNDGTYTITVRYIGYKDILLNSIKVKAETLLNFEMESDAQALGEVSVVAKKNLEGERALQMERQKATLAIENLGAKEIIERYRAGDDKALAHVDCFADVLAMCLGNLFTVIDPHLVVLGGGLSNFTELYPLLNERVPRALLRVAKAPRIEPARYGDAGGVRGAAFLNLTD